MNDQPRLPFEFELLQDVVALDLQVLSSKRSDFMETVHMKMTLHEEPDILTTASNRTDTTTAPLSAQ